MSVGDVGSILRAYESEYVLSDSQTDSNYLLYQDRLFCIIVKQIALRPREHTPDLEALDSKPS